MMASGGDGSSGVRFALVTDSGEPSGVGEHMLALAEGLRPYGRVDIIFAGDGPAAAFAERASAEGLLSFRPALHDLRCGGDCVRDWIARQRPDVVHVHAGAPWEGHELVRCAAATGAAVVRTEHLPFVIDRDADRRAYLDQASLVKRLICVSEAAQRSYVASGVPRERLRVVRNGIAPRSPGRKSGEVRAALGIADDRIVCLTVARMTPQKGHRLIIEAAPSVLARCPQALFVWVGTGPMRRDLEAEIDRRHLSDHILLLGQREDVPDLLAASDMFVLPSAFEGLPIAALEASAAGLSVAGTRAPGLAEAVQHGVTGLLVGVEDAAGLGTAIVVLSGDAGALMGQAGRRLVAERFTRERMAEQTLGVYQEAIEGG